ncbi:alpha/beta fold hydrolase [Roseovarius sp. A21]|uniref:Alpha/beta fold hydrolase n=1 Tax=Roseovarius bejariae TaxID=2576383 RepID=A0A844D358_9RHOB|nr:alpha/beta fold hydrolase [Roseovarius bejariae]MRU16654.1 alpha/beta fold hydrolase [Roseovarius bejariae]
MSEILLVHGSCHGAWCWRDVVPALERLGHDVRAIDLPGHGTTPWPLADITLDLYAQAILDAIETRAVVVGHSMAGFPISAAAEIDPTKIARLVYLCAYAPRDGASLVDMRMEAPRQPLLEAIEKTPDGLGFTFRETHLAKALYHDCPEGTVDYARQNLCVQAIKPQATPIRLGKAYQSVPKTYIRCDDDQAIPPEYQRTMTGGWPAEDVHALPTSHSPFFAMPGELAQLIDQITQDAA